MDNSKDTILQEAKDKLEFHLGEAKYWERFIGDAKRMTGNNKEQIKSPTNTISWAKIREAAEKILTEKGIIENAAQFQIEFAKAGYEISKEKLSSCLTHAKTNFKKFDYNKDKGGWYLVKENLLKAV